MTTISLSKSYTHLDMYARLNLAAGAVPGPRAPMDSHNQHPAEEGTGA